MRFIRRGLGSAVAVALGLAACRGTPGAVRQPAAAPSEKESRTAAQQKIDSQLLYEIYRTRGQAEAKGVPPGATLVRIDATGRALVDIRAAVSDALVSLVTSRGGAIVSTSPQYYSIIAWVPLLEIERIAEQPAVRAVSPAAQAVTLPQT